MSHHHVSLCTQCLTIMSHHRVSCMSQTGDEENGWVVDEPEELGLTQPRRRKKHACRRVFRYGVAIESNPHEVFYIPPKDNKKMLSFEDLPSEYKGAVTPRKDGKLYHASMRLRGDFKVVHKHTPQQLDTYKYLTTFKPLKDILLCGFDTRLTAKDMRSLAKGRALKDSVVNYYMQLLQAETNNSDDPKMCIDSHFHDALHNPRGFLPTEQASGRKNKYLRHKHLRLQSHLNWPETKRWFRRRDLFRRHRLLAPIFHPPADKKGVGHWTILDTDIIPSQFKKSKSKSKVTRTQPKYWMTHHDSYEGIVNKKKFIDVFSEYLELYHHSTRASWISPNNITLRTRVKTPQQHNGVDCGVHVCAVAFCLCHNIPIEHFTTEEQIQNFRVHMAVSMREHKLTGLISYGPKTVDISI